MAAECVVSREWCLTFLLATLLCGTRNCTDGRCVMLVLYALEAVGLSLLLLRREEMARGAWHARVLLSSWPAAGGWTSRQ